VYLIGFMDDHSRYIVGWGLYASQGSAQVLEVLRNAIGQYGAPREILSDQGRQYFAWR
jgi:transposase InsO family protein